MLNVITIPLKPRLAAVRRDEPDYERDVQLQEVQLPEELQR